MLQLTTDLIFLYAKVFGALYILRFIWRQKDNLFLTVMLPGPFAYPIIGNLYDFVGLKTSEDIFNKFIECFTTYGRTFRIWLGPKLVVVVSTPKDLDLIYKSRAFVYKDLTIMKGMRSALGDGLITAPAEIWINHRRMLMPTFHQSSMNGFIDIFVENANKLVEELKPRAGEFDFDIYPEIFRTTIYFLCESIFGLTGNQPLLQEVQNTLMLHLNSTMEICFQRMAKPWFYLDYIYDRSSYAEQFNMHMKNLNAVSDKVIKLRRQELQIQKKPNAIEDTHVEENVISKRKNLLDLLLDVNENGKVFSDKEIKDHINSFMAGGTDTTANVLSFACMLLGSNPECQERVYEEIQSIFGNSTRNIKLEDLSKMEYIERVLKETLRLFPPLPMLVRYAKGQTKLDKITVPKGTTVLFTNWMAHRDPDVWPEPLKFDPDRFLPEESAKRQSGSFIPFGFGIRSCIGMKYAMMSMKVLLCTLVRKYKIKSNFSPETVKLGVEIILKSLDGHPLQIELRK